jgi:ABC-type amino acid transport substrate-binding protein
VTTGKADMAITEPTIAGGFMAKNPGKLKRAAVSPLRMQSMNIAVPVGDVALKDMLDITLSTLHDTGFIKRAYEKYAIGPGIYYYPGSPWHADADEKR